MRFDANTPREQIQQFERAITAAGITNPMRAAQRALNGVALEARKSITGELGAVFDKPTRWTMNAIEAKLTKPSDGALSADGLLSEVRVRGPHSAVLKHHLGFDEREPGDVGPADKHIYTPFWDVAQSDTAKADRVSFKPTAGGSMPRTVLKKLGQKANKPKTRRTKTVRYPDPQGVFFGRPNATAPLGFWVRPTRERTGDKVANKGSPRLIVGAFDKATYDETLTPAWQRESVTAMGQLPRLLEEQYDRLTRARTT